jgi:hypothetical protein
VKTGLSSISSIAGPMMGFKSSERFDDSDILKKQQEMEMRDSAGKQ